MTVSVVGCGKRTVHTTDISQAKECAEQLAYARRVRKGEDPHAVLEEVQ